ncbi:MAG TPA: cation:proton antiporter [Bacteroidia bacterium]|jgi:Kef-type K+ transport system membrane component KefB|nr:cation:proton antiporter [Bacteroidia bacterium]
MTAAIIITLCVLLLFAYVFDVTASKTRIPSVVLLLLLGWGVRQGTIHSGLSVPDLNPVLPVLGTVGLILIVLEGSLELELNRSKIPVIVKSAFGALLPMLGISFGMAMAFQYFGGVDLLTGLANAVPFAVISSAIAIPSAKHLERADREFITYESSLSDIFGVIFFNFVALNDHVDGKVVGNFLFELLVLLLISIVSTIALAFLLSKSRHHVKYAPIILLLILIYTILKIYHLPSLIFILLFGLALGNLKNFRENKFIQKVHPEILNREVHKFRELTVEMTFLIRSLFFLLFGYLIETKELINPDTIIWAVAVTAGIFVIRALVLKLFSLPLQPLLFIAPRGLITILLFLSIPLNQSLGLANKSLVIQVIILTSFVMMYGLMKTKKRELPPETQTGNQEII